MNPLDYSLCCQTVTVYRRQETGVLRFILENCFLQVQRGIRKDMYGKEQTVSFLLIVPGGEQQVFPGDRVVEGIGPEVTAWEQMCGLAEIQYAQPCYWEGELCHTEAGRKE